MRRLAVARPVAEVLHAPGRPLSPAVRRAFEPRFGHDFGSVRVHDDGQGRESAAALGATAYTFGQHVVGAVDNDASLAHELAHVVQQSRSAIVRNAVSDPHGEDEREADRAAAAALAGDRVQPPAAAPARIQRQVQEGVTLRTQPFAKACVVQLHGDETDALATGEELFKQHCVNLVFVDNPSQERWVHVDVGGTICRVDPNRIFSSDDVTKAHALQPCAVPQDKVVAEVRSWRTRELARKISLGRRGTGAGLAGPLPVIALHTNRGGGFGTSMWKKGGSEHAAAESRPSRMGKVTSNPLEPDPKNPSNVMLATQPEDAEKLGATRNIALQSTQAPDDGSLSLALRSERYVNVERLERPRKGGKPASPAIAASLTEAVEVLDRFGAKGKCAPTDDEKAIEELRQPESPDEAKSGWLARGILRLFRKLVRESDRVRDLPPVLPREEPPESVTKVNPKTKEPRCKIYKTKADIEAEKKRWVGFIAAHTPQTEIVQWMIGKTTPPAKLPENPADTSRKQLDCMLEGLKASTKKESSDVVLPNNALVQSSRRTFGDQATIWREKFNFTRRTPFDRISDDARVKCGPTLLKSSETLWDTSNDRHKFCWGVSTKAPAGTGATAAQQLTGEEREKEILQASSAPGISRHHWGTDFDILDPGMHAEDWERGGAFADEYSWLRGNAGQYGFVQAFTHESAAQGVAHMEERWHWSYWPVSDALVDYVTGHQAELEKALVDAPMPPEKGKTSKWGAAPELSYVQKNWKSLLLNVNREPEL